MPKVEATLRLVRHWNDMRRNIPHEGPPGISYRSEIIKGNAGSMRWFVLEYRNKLGNLVGFMKLQTIQMGRDSSPLALETLAVKPGYRHQGIATKLLSEAMRRLPRLDLSIQEYTVDGAAFVNAFLERRANKSASKI